MLIVACRRSLGVRPAEWIAGYSAWVLCEFPFQLVPSPFSPPLDHEPKVPEGWLGRLFLCDGFEAVSKEQTVFFTRASSLLKISDEGGMCEVPGLVPAAAPIPSALTSSLPFLGLGLSSIHADLAVHSTIAWSVLAVHHRVESTKELESGLMS